MTPKLLLFSLALGIGLPLDQLSKQWIIANVHYGDRIVIIPGLFDITHVRNPGGAFSFFADGPVEQRMLFFIGTTIVAIVLLVLFYRRLLEHERLSALALGVILAGAIGNLIDRVVYGEVIDFLDVHLWGGYTWPTFNIADSCIVVGVALLVAEIFLTPEPESELTGASVPVDRDESAANGS